MKRQRSESERASESESTGKQNTGRERTDAGSGNRITGLHRTVGNQSVQATAGAGNDSGDSPASIAREGVSGSGDSIPHADTLRPVFPDVDLSTINAHTGPRARDATDRLGAEAYATGDAIAFRRSPSRSLVAHEVVHVLQQRSARRDPSAVGQEGDRFERAANSRASRVTAGGRPARVGLPAGPVPGVQLQRAGGAGRERGTIRIVRVRDGVRVIGTSREGETVQQFARRLWEHYIDTRFGDVSPQLRAEMVAFVMQTFTPTYSDPQYKPGAGKKAYVGIDDAGEKRLVERFGVRLATDSSHKPGSAGDPGSREAKGRDRTTTTTGPTSTSEARVPGKGEKEGIVQSEFLTDIGNIVKQMKLLYNLSYFIKGMVTGVATNVKPEAAKTLAGKLQWAQYYQFRHPVAWTKGLAIGIYQGAVGLAEIPASIKDGIAFAQWLMTDASPETAEILGEHAGKQQAGNVEKLADLEGAAFAEALATIVGQIAFEIVLEVVGSKGLGAAAKGISKVVKALPDDVAKKIKGLIGEDKTTGQAGETPDTGTTATSVEEGAGGTRQLETETRSSPEADTDKTPESEPEPTSDTGETRTEGDVPDESTRTTTEGTEPPYPEGVGPDTTVQLNTESGIYHSPGSPYYGKQLKNGEYMSAREARSRGARASKVRTSKEWPSDVPERPSLRDIDAVDDSEVDRYLTTRNEPLRGEAMREQRRILREAEADEDFAAAEAGEDYEDLIVDETHGKDPPGVPPIDEIRSKLPSRAKFEKMSQAERKKLLTGNLSWAERRKLLIKNLIPAERKRLLKQKVTQRRSEGRVMDVGEYIEVTISGRKDDLPTSKYNQLWIDLIRNRKARLRVPKLTDRARRNLAKLAKAAEEELQQSVHIEVTQTAPNFEPK